MKNCITIILSLLLVSCFSTYRIKKDENREPIMKENLYSFNKKMTFDNSKILDTTSLYVKLTSKFSSDRVKENPSIMIFHNDGFFEKTSKKYFRNFKPQRTKKSIYYGGKFILEENKIRIEKFYPSTDGKTNRYKKVISKGEIHGDTISIEIFRREHKYVKRSYEEVFK